MLNYWFFHLFLFNFFLFKFSLLLNFLFLLLQFSFNVISQFFIISLNLMSQNWWSSKKDTMQSKGIFNIIWSTSNILYSLLILFFINWESYLEKHFNWEESQYCTCSFSSATSTNCKYITILTNDIFLLLSQTDLEVWYLCQQFNKNFSTLKIYKSFDKRITNLLLILSNFLSF